MNFSIKPQPGVSQIPVYKPGRPIEEVQKQFGITDVIKLASNENPLGTSPKALEAIRQAATQVNMYPDGKSAVLAAALAQRFGVQADQVAVGNGADGLIMELCMAYLDEQSEVVVSRSSFPMYDVFSYTMRARLVKTPLKEYGLDLQAMARAITERTKLVFVCNPNNPTGTALNAVEVDAFLKDVPEHVIVVFDEAYYEYAASPEFPDTIDYVRRGVQNVVVLRTFSKAYGLAGVRVGYGFACAPLLAPLKLVKEPFAVNLLAQAAGLAALEDDAFCARSVALNNEGKAYLYREFERLGLFYVPTYTNFILTRLGPKMLWLVERLMEHGIIIRPGDAYDLPEFARITIGTAEQNRRLVQTLEKLLAEA